MPESPGVLSSTQPILDQKLCPFHLGYSCPEALFQTQQAKNTRLGSAIIVAHWQCIDAMMREASKGAMRLQLKRVVH